MKKTILCFTLALVCISLTACKGTAKIDDTYSVAELSARVKNTLGEGYIGDTSGYTEEYFPMPSYVLEHEILYRPQSNVLDEFGIFRVEEGHAKELASLIKEDYLAAAYEKNRDFYNSYMPKETPKLQNAEVRTYGNYVVYAILSPADRAALFGELQTISKE